jgi:hypothetical protein
MGASSARYGWIACVAAALLSWSANALADSYPRVTFVFGYRPFDESCERWRNVRIDPQWYVELKSKIGSFQDYWDREGALLMAAAIAESGKPFRHRDVVATLTLCPVPSMSRPLLINMRAYLDGPSRDKARPMLLFSELVFHELLHTHVSAVLPQDQSVLLARYKGESPVVRNHLHLMALMKAAYLRLGREDQLRQLIERDSLEDGPEYKRAWQIVTDIEGHDAFVQELKR